MKKHTIGLIVLVILTLACLIALIIVLTNSCKNSGFRLKKSFTTPTPSKPTDTLFIWEDSQGTEISKLPDFNYSYDKSITNSFKTVAFIAENKPYVDTTNAIWDDMTTQYPTTSNQEYWLSIYFGNDGMFKSCQTDTTTCQQSLDQYIKPYLANTKYKLKGIVIDKEGVGSAWPHISDWINSLNLEVIWGGGISSCGQPPPSKIPFLGCLGETYTLCDSTWSKLVNDCKMDLKNFWKLVPQSDPPTIPLVCMTGNCQETSTAQGCTKCNDYRISEADLKQLVTNKPIGQNLGLWYGAGRMNKCPKSAKCSRQCCY